MSPAHLGLARAALVTIALGATAIGTARAAAPDRLRDAAPDRLHAAAPDPLHGAAPTLRARCVGCHNPAKKKGGLDLEPLLAAGARLGASEVEVLRLVGERVEAQEMPPDDAPALTTTERASLLAAVQTISAHAAARAPVDPGRVTMRRLNRAEYDNSVRDLLGIDLQPARDFPSDDLGYGFDNIGDVLSLPPVLAERYLLAAERIAARAIATEVPPRLRKTQHLLRDVVPRPAGAEARRGALLVPPRGEVRIRHDASVSGTYRIAVRGHGAGQRVLVRVDGTRVAAIDLTARRRRHTVTLPLTPGPHDIVLAAAGDPPARQTSPPSFSQPSASQRSPSQPSASLTPPSRASLSLASLSIEGPLPGTWTLPPSHFRLLPRAPGATIELRRSSARTFLAPFVRRAFRRAVSPAEIERIASFVDDTMARGGSFAAGMQRALQAVLVSPHFLFRVERDDAGGAADAHETAAVHPFALASRLSYFLWSSTPDDHLLALAESGALAEPETLAAEVRRMMADPRARALTTRFAPQWLETNDLVARRPSRKHFPAWNDELRAAMLTETELFFEAIVREDLPVRAFIDARFTFLNEPLARHYGLLDKVKDDEGRVLSGKAFRRVTLPAGERGGLLGQGSILTVTSNPTRTSPVKRGRWVLEAMLGAPPPPAPPNVPQLPDNEPGAKTGKPKTGRALLEAHRKDPACASCHKRMDPIGFGMEGFDAIGAARAREGDMPIDTSGALPGGVSFVGTAELKALLLAREPQFRRALATKLLTFALGRGVEPSDRPALDAICAETERDGKTFTRLVLAIAKSAPFQRRRVAQEPPPVPASPHDEDEGEDDPPPPVAQESRR